MRYLRCIALRFPSVSTFPSIFRFPSKPSRVIYLKDSNNRVLLHTYDLRLQNCSLNSNSSSFSHHYGLQSHRKSLLSYCIILVYPLLAPYKKFVQYVQKNFCACAVDRSKQKRAYTIVWSAWNYFTWFQGKLLSKPSKIMPKMKFSHKILVYFPHES